MSTAFKGLIFDMDNTLLRSHIDFAAMKQATFRYLAERGILAEDLPLNMHTPSTLIKEAIGTGRMTSEVLAEMWRIVQNFELAGMEGAELEPGVPETLEWLGGRFRLAVVTNNSVLAAKEALRSNGILHRFARVVGREDMRSMKPSPDGFLAILAQWPDMLPEQWLSIGDSWVDGKASTAAGVPFVAYRADDEGMELMGVSPMACINDIRVLRELLSR